MRVLCFLFLMACTTNKTSGEADTGAGDGAAAESWEGLEWAVGTPGPYSTGYRTWDLSYDPGLGEGERTVRLNLWYPTEDLSGVTPTYTVGSSDDATWLDASAAPSVYGGGYPVHVHSHGHQGWGATSVFLAKFLASHGWVTVAPDHTDNTLLDNIDPKPTSIYVHRATDISAVLNALEALPADDPLAAVDTSAVVLSGHSFGAYTTWAVGGAAFDVAAIETRGSDAELSAFEIGLGDARVVGTIPMAGTYDTAWFGSTGYQNMTIPALFMSGSNDSVGQTEQWDLLTELDLTWIELEGACHQSFALGACATLDVDLGFEIVQTYALAFARSQVFDDADATVVGILAGEIAVADEVHFRRR
jgi:predicted dienelactone hydrolase